MSSRRSKYEFYQEASLSQKLANKYPEYSMYAGSDPETSEALAILKVLKDFNLIEDSFEVQLTTALLNEKRKALFATSEKTDVISKMGMQQPKAELEFFGGADDEDEDT